MNIKICDDEAVVCRKIQRFLALYGIRYGLEYTVDVYQSGEELLSSDYSNADLFFLDILMEGINGVDTALRVREKNKNALIIFLTGSKEYVFEGYKAKAFRYLLKPLAQKDFIEVMKAVEKEIKNENSDLFSFTYHKEKMAVPYRDMMYFEIVGRTMMLHMEGDRIYHLSETMKHMEDQMAERTFYRIHKGYLVNMDKISSYTNRDVTLTDGSVLPISKYRLKKFKEALAEYWSEKM